MAFTVEDFRDLVQLLEQRPDWREELRRLVLTQELLELPQLVRQLATQQEALAQQVAQLAQQVGQLATQQEALGQRLDRFTLQVTDSLNRLAGRMLALTEAQLRMTLDLERVKGHDLERQYREKAGAYFGRIIRRAHTLTDPELYRLLDEAVAQGKLSDDESDEVALADAIVRGRRRTDQETVYLVVEVSWGVGVEDVERAAQRAALLARTGRISIPVVAGTVVIPQGELIARALRVWQVVDGRVVEPEEPAGPGLT